jgi:Tol biopolymer transport system component
VQIRSINKIIKEFDLRITYLAFFLLTINISCSDMQAMTNKLNELQAKEKWIIVFSSQGTALYSFSFEGENRKFYSTKDSFIGSPSLSIDGMKIVFSALKTVTGDFDIMMINSDGTGVHKLFSYPFAKGAALSPDGKKIAFWGDNNETIKSTNLYLYSIDDSKIRLLQKDATYSMTAFTPSWSPDSKQIVYASLDGFVTIIDINKLTTTKLSKGDAPSWSPDGKAIIFREGISYFRVLPDNKTTEYYINGHRYYSINSKGENKHLMFDGKSHIWEFAGDAYAPVVWSPDSKYILFFKPYDSLTEGPNRSKIYAMSIEKKEITFIKKQSGHPMFSWAKGR